MTPLHIASIKGFKELAIFLIDQKSNLEAEDIDNKTPVRMKNYIKFKLFFTAVLCSKV